MGNKSVPVSNLLIIKKITMPKSSSEKEMMVANENNIAQLSRRKFLGYAGATTGLLVGLSACKKDPKMPTNPKKGVDLGSGDFGILNYAYALEQLEAAFYIKVIMSKYSGMTALETAF